MGDQDDHRSSAQFEPQSSVESCVQSTTRTMPCREQSNVSSFNLTYNTRPSFSGNSRSRVWLPAFRYPSTVYPHETQTATMSFPPSPNRQGQAVRRPSQTMQTFGFHHTPSPINPPVPSTSADTVPSRKKKLTHTEALEQIRTFLRSQSSYDVFPVSFRLIVLDHHLVVKKALNTMLANGRSC